MAARVDNTNAALSAFTKSSNKALNTLVTNQNKQQSGLFDQYTTASNSQEKLPALYDRLSNELGIGDMSKVAQGYKDQILHTQQLLGNLTSDVNDRNKGTFTTQAQADRQIAAEGAPLQNNLAQLGYAYAPTAEALSSAQGTLGTMLNLNVQQQAKDLNPMEMRINSLGDKFSREITGFTTQRQGSLDALMDKITRNRQLSDAEWEHAQTLAQEERQYQRQLSLAKQSIANTGLSFPSLGGGPSAASRTAAQWYSLGSGGVNIPSAKPAGSRVVQPARGSAAVQNATGVRIL